VEDVEKLIWEVERRPPMYKNKRKEYSDRNLKDKLWYEVYESVVKNCSKLPAEHKSEKM
jgi:Sec7-like guanine-nucleotide exchange factor